MLGRESRDHPSKFRGLYTLRIDKSTDNKLTKSSQMKKQNVNRVLVLHLKSLKSSKFVSKRFLSKSSFWNNENQSNHTRFLGFFIILYMKFLSTYYYGWVNVSFFIYTYLFRKDLNLIIDVKFSLSCMHSYIKSYFFLLIYDNN